MEEKKYETITHSYQRSTDKVKNFLKDNLSKLIVVVMVLTYVAQGCFELVQKDWDFGAFIGRAGLSMVTGITLYTSMRLSGLRDGRKKAEFIASYNLYAEQKERVSRGKAFKLPAFCCYKNSQALEEAKQSLLEEYGIQYILWKKGSYEEGKPLYDRLDDEQKKVLKFINNGRIKVNMLTARGLLTDSPKLSKRDLKNGRTIREEKDYTRDNVVKDLLTMVLWSAIFSAYILKPIVDGDTLSSILWNTWQIIVWVAGGVSKYEDAIQFMINEYRQTHLIEKTELLSEFLSIMEHNEEMLDQYDYVGMEIKRLEKEGNKDE